MYTILSYNYVSTSNAITFTFYDFVVYTTKHWTIDGSLKNYLSRNYTTRDKNTRIDLK